MYTLKGFISYPELIDNTLGVTAPLGEISKDSLTYTKETGIYKHDGFPGTLLYSFYSTADLVSQIEVPLEFKDLSIRVGDFIKRAAIEHRLTSDKAASLQEINIEFNGILINIDIGTMVTMDGFWMPEWISFNVTDSTNFIKLWFSDQAFSVQYDHFEYEFIAPLENLDDFFRPRTQVLGLLAEVSLKSTMERIEVIRAEYPYTLIKSEQYNWVDPADATFEYPTEWTVMIYGRAGNDLDQIRLALRDWILENSTHTREEWITIFPDIFIPTEFIITPTWHKFAIPNQTIQAGMYSPVVGAVEAGEIATHFCFDNGYEEANLLANTQVAPVAYKTMSLIVTGNNLNRDGIKHFTGHFPDYTNIPLTHADFARMSPKTQDWIRMVVAAMVSAEQITAYTLPPTGYSRINRNGVIYVAKEFDGVQYLVVSRLSAFEAFGI